MQWVLLTCGHSEYIKSVPDTLESLISEKKLLQASSLLLRSTKIIAKSDMQEIGALADLRAYLTGQESVSLLFVSLLPLILALDAT